MNFFEIIGDIIKNYSLWILKGVGLTLLVSILGTILGLVIGLIIGIIRTYPVNKDKKILYVLKKFVDFIIGAYVEIFRGTPMMVQAMVIYWGYAFISGGDTLNVVISALIIVSINTGAYMAEIVRGGIISIDKGQFEGAQAIGMSHFKTMIHVVIPQVLRNILPSVCNEFIINIKDTSVLNVIGFTELYFVIDDITTGNFQYFATYFFGAIIYFILTFSISRILLLIEKKLAGKKNYQVAGSGNMDAESIMLENSTKGE